MVIFLKNNQKRKKYSNKNTVNTGFNYPVYYATETKRYFYESRVTPHMWCA